MRYIIIALVVAATIIGVAIGYVLPRHQENALQHQTESIYVNNTYLFKLRYPSDWTVVTDNPSYYNPYDPNNPTSNGVIPGLDEIEFAKDANRYSTVLTVFAQLRPPSLTEEDWLKVIGAPFYVPRTTEVVNVNGYSFKRFTVRLGGPDVPPGDRIYYITKLTQYPPYPDVTKPTSNFVGFTILFPDKVNAIDQALAMDVIKSFESRGPYARPH